MSLPRRAVHHPVTTAMVFVALFVLGLMSLLRLGQELFPEINLPSIHVVTVSPGVGPFEIEENITRPIEAALAGLTGMKSISSTSAESFSQITVSFNEGIDVDVVIHDVREQLNRVADDFPDGTQRTRLFKFNASTLPSLVLHAYTESPGIDIRALIEKEVVPQLERIPGVARVELFGGREEVILAELNLDSLSKRSIPITQVLQAFGAENVNLPAGTVTLDDRVVNLRASGAFRTIEDVGEVLIGSAEGVPIFLRDVAEISRSFLPQRQFVRTRGSEGLRLSIQKQSGFNTVEINDAVLARIARLEQQLPPSVRFEVLDNQANNIRNSIGGVTDAAWQGGLLAILILLAFLRNLRSTFIIAVVIPISVIATFSLIDFGGLTINITTLLGITLSIGMFVDNAIVVLESIYRKQLAGHSPREAAIIGAEEVAMAITASTLTTMAVFVPMIFVQGLAGVLFQPFSMTIAFSLFISLIAALTLIPALCAHFLRVEALVHSDADLDEISLADVRIHSSNRALNAFSSLIQRALLALDESYARGVAWALRHPIKIVVGAVVLFGLSIGSILLLGMEFLPEGDEALFTVEFETRVGAPYELTLEKALQIEQIVREEAPGMIRTIAGRIGSGGSHFGAVAVALVDRSQRTEDIWTIVNRVDRRMARELLDVQPKVVIEGMAALAAMAGGETSPVVIEITGENVDALARHADEVVAVLEGTPGTRNIRSSHGVGLPEILFRIKRMEAVSLGLSPREIAVTLRTAFNGTEVSRFSSGETELDIHVVLREEDRTDLEGFSRLYFMTRDGRRIPLENVVEIIEDEGPIRVTRKNRARIVRVLGSLTGEVPLNRVTAEIQERLRAAGPPPLGIDREMSGTSREMNTSFRSLFTALMLAVMLVYMVMASQFESFLNPFIVMFSVPFAVIGLTAALLLTNTTFNLLSFVGAILLVGIVVNNAIVLIDYVGQLQARGIPLRKAIIQGGKTRLKPILMTSLTTLLGLVPMAIGGTGGASHLRAPIARAVIGGLTTSTFITVILIPTLYFLVQHHLLGVSADEGRPTGTGGGKPTDRNAPGNGGGGGGSAIEGGLRPSAAPLTAASLTAAPLTAAPAWVVLVLTAALLLTGPGVTPLRAQTLTLAEVRRAAAENSHVLAGAAARRAGLEAAVREARARRLPAVQTTASGSYLTHPPKGITVPAGAFGALQLAPLPAPRTLLPATPIEFVPDALNTYFKLTANVDLPLFTWGRIQAGVSAATAQVTAQQHALEGARRTLNRDIALAYFGLIHAARTVETLAAAEQLLTQIVADQEAAFAAGAVRLEAVLNARADLAQMRSRRIQAAEKQVTTALSLSILSGIEVSADRIAAGWPGAPTAARIPETAASTGQQEARAALTAAATATSTDLRRIDALMVAAHAGVRAQQGSRPFRPDLGLRVGFEYAGQEIPGAADWNDNWKGGTTITVALNMSVFDGGAARARMNQTEEQLRELAHQRAALAQGLEINSRALLERITTAEAGLRAARAAREFAAERARNAAVSYANELITRREELGARVLLRVAELELAQAEWSLIEARVELEFLAGVPLD